MKKTNKTLTWFTNDDRVGVINKTSFDEKSKQNVKSSFGRREVLYLTHFKEMIAENKGFNDDSLFGGRAIISRLVFRTA